MKKIRVLFGRNAQFFRRFFGDRIERQIDMEVVDEIDEPVELLLSLRNADVDVVLLPMEHGGTSALSSHLFAEYPTVTLVLVDEDGRDAFIERLCPHRSRITDVSPDGIMSALRLAASISSESEQGSALRTQQ